MTTKTSESSERRKNPRIEFHLPVAMSGQKGLVKIRNFGIDGAFIQTEDPLKFKSGGQVVLVMKLPHEERAMGVKASIAHVSAKGMGVGFVDVAPQDTMSLESCFNVFRETMPMPDA